MNASSPQAAAAPAAPNAVPPRLSDDPTLFIRVGAGVAGLFFVGFLGWAALAPLDAGAYGVICPMVNTPEQAAEFVSYLRYPPLGQRSFGPTRANLSAGANYAGEANDEILGFAMIETATAMRNLDAIAATPGLDGIYVGPADLTLSLARGRLAPAFDREEPEMVEALGHNVPRVFMLVFGGGAALAGLAGVIGGNTYVTEPAMAASVGSIIFVVVVVGGMGSLAGAFLASLLIGIVQTFAVALDYSLIHAFKMIGVAVTEQTFGYPLLKLTVSQVAPILPYLFLVLILIFRPKGLLGTRED